MVHDRLLACRQRRSYTASCQPFAAIMQEATQSTRIQVLTLILLLLCLLVTKLIPSKVSSSKEHGRSAYLWPATGSAAASAIEDMYFNEMRPLEFKIDNLCLKNRKKKDKNFEKLCSSMIKQLLDWKRKISLIARDVRNDARSASSTNAVPSRQSRRRRSADDETGANGFEPLAEFNKTDMMPNETTALAIGQQQTTVEARNRMLVERILQKMDSDKILQHIRDRKPYNAERQCDYDLLRSATMEEFLHLCSDEFSRYNISAQLVKGSLIVCGMSNNSAGGFAATKYKRRQWISQLEKDLTQDTNNYPKSHAMAKAYRDHIQPITQVRRYKSLDRNFRWFMHRYNIYFGNRDHSILRPMSLYNEFEPFQSTPLFRNALENFERAISQSFPEVPKYNGTGGKLKVAIITGPYGAGHTSTAAALTKAYQESPDFDVIKVDECTDFPDTLYIATCGKYHSCKIYNDVIVRDNDLEKAEFLSMLNLMLTDYIPQNKFGKLNERLRQERPDLIISTVHHIPEITENSYLLNRPLRIMVTDYEFPQKQWHALNHLPADLIKFWIPSTNRNIFRPMVEEYLKKSWEGRHSNSRTLAINETLFNQSLPMESIFEVLGGVLELLPFPVAAAIKPPKDWSDVTKSRNKLLLSESLDRKVISVAQGGTPNTQMMSERIMQLINDSRLITGKFQIAVVTSGIQPLINRVTEMFLSFNISIMTELNKKEMENSDDKVIARVFQRLQYPTDMAELYKASDLLISKSGGATSAEVIASATKFVNGFPLWEWEIENTKHLESLGLSPDISERRNNERTKAIPNRKVYTLPPTSAIMVKRINAMLTKPRLFEAPARCFNNEDARRAAVDAVRSGEDSRQRYAEQAKLREIERERLGLIDLNNPRELLRKLSSGLLNVHHRLLSFIK